MKDNIKKTIKKTIQMEHGGPLRDIPYIPIKSLMRQVILDFDKAYSDGDMQLADSILENVERFYGIQSFINAIEELASDAQRTRTLAAKERLDGLRDYVKDRYTAYYKSGEDFKYI